MLPKDTCGDRLPRGAVRFVFSLPPLDRIHTHGHNSAFIQSLPNKDLLQSSCAIKRTIMSLCFKHFQDFYEMNLSVCVDT